MTTCDVDQQSSQATGTNTPNLRQFCGSRRLFLANVEICTYCTYVKIKKSLKYRKFRVFPGFLVLLLTGSQLSDGAPFGEHPKYAPKGGPSRIVNQGLRPLLIRTSLCMCAKIGEYPGKFRRFASYLVCLVLLLVLLSCPTSNERALQKAKPHLSVRVLGVFVC